MTVITKGSVIISVTEIEDAPHVINDNHVLVDFLVAKSPPTAEMTVVLVPVAWVRMVELEVTVGTETSESEVDEATPTGGGGGGGAEPSAEP